MIQKFLFWANNERGGAEQASDPYERVEKLFQDILEARTATQFEKVIEDAAPVDLNGGPQLVRSDAPPRSQERLVIRPRQSDWMLTRTEFK